MRSKKIALAALALTLGAVAGCAASPAQPAASTATTVASPLDGRRFHVSLADGDKRMADDLSFATGMFDSSACRGFGFGPSSYTARTDAGAVVFEVDAHAGDLVNHWRGRVEGSRVSGTLVSEKNGAPQAKYAFEGEGI